MNCVSYHAFLPNTSGPCGHPMHYNFEFDHPTPDGTCHPALLVNMACWSNATNSSIDFNTDIAPISISVINGSRAFAIHNGTYKCDTTPIGTADANVTAPVNVTTLTKENGWGFLEKEMDPPDFGGKSACTSPKENRTTARNGTGVAPPKEASATTGKETSDGVVVGLKGMVLLGAVFVSLLLQGL
ncbi:hypothetical protein HK097_010939 [Rhizophlyctis rosea]|uniref:Uncharacterized protein n=1 Tax=Rhizophlyctis rosea TaxID=64517 RepID=A0AAD5S8D4_9FUNG|nr:hypothetical protein HK097_010939 [Rhizophlyctis rosea]